jgi:F420 biosynthesis protein FbiB-like protein
MSFLPLNLSVPSQLEFWEYLERLVVSCRLVIDRPRGSAHPRFPQFIYPLDYGYLEGVGSTDGSELDAWLGSAGARSLDALLLTVDLFKQDAEINLLLGCTPADQQAVLHAANQGSMRAVLVPRTAQIAHGAAHGPAQDFSRWLSSRRSVRRFSDQPLDPGLLRRLLEGAACAPSAHHRQPWRFVVCSSPEARTRLAEVLGAEFERDLLADGVAAEVVMQRVERSRRRIQSAQAAVVLCADRRAQDVYLDEPRSLAESLMAAQGVAMAGENLLLAAHAAGLAGVWLCAPLFAPRTVQAAFDLPEEWQPQGLVLLGYPGETPAPRESLPLDQVACFL